MNVYIDNQLCNVCENDISRYVIYSAGDASEKTVEVKIQLDGDVDRAIVKPKSAGIELRPEGGVISFRAKLPSKLCVEFPGAKLLPIFLFLYEPETNVPQGDGVRYYAPGEYFEEEVRLNSGDVLYLAEGAVLHAHIVADDVENISICGRGVIDLAGHSQTRRRMAIIRRCKNITFKDVTFNGSYGWCCAFFGCEQIAVDSVNIMTWQMCGDGVDVVGSHDVEIKHSFLCTNDDCVALKSTDYCGPQGLGNVYNVKVHHCVMWNQIYGNGIEIGFETRCDEICNVEFSDIDIIRVEEPGWQACGCITIHNGDRARVHDIVYRNIRIEDPSSRTFDFRVLNSHYSRDTERGRIENVLVENVSIESGLFPPSAVIGFDDTSNVSNVRFVNFSVCGKPIENYVDAKMIIDKTKSIIFETK